VDKVLGKDGTYIANGTFLAKVSQKLHHFRRGSSTSRRQSTIDIEETDGTFERPVLE
jgi:hypothetical protein